MKGKAKIQLYSMEQEKRRECKISELPLKNSYIMRISKEKYNNNEQCIIIKGKIANQVYCSLLEYLNDCVKKGTYSQKISNLPVLFQESIAWMPEMTYIKFGNDAEGKR